MHVLHQPPGRLRFSDHARKLGQHSHAVARWRRATCPAEVLAGRPADNADKVTSRRVEVFDALAKKCVRFSHYTETGLLETTVQQAGARKE